MDKFHLKPAAGNEGHARAGSPAIDSSQLGSRDEFLSTHVPSRPVTPMNADNEAPRAARHHGKTRKIVLCFDGTGNKFHGDDSDSNILKIFRMLDRTASDQCKTCLFTSPSDCPHPRADAGTDHYYQRMFCLDSGCPALLTE